jgi:hypothetical protein
VPAATYLAQLVPWWRAGTWPLAPLTLGLALAVGLAATFAPWTGKRRWGTAAAVGAATAAVIAVDAATGSPLSLDAPFGDNPIIAGRFHGIGNVASFAGGWVRWIVLGWVVLGLVAYVGHRQGWLRLPASADRRTAGRLLAALLVLGAGLNDSGLGITAFAFYAAMPLLVPMIEPAPTAPPSSLPAVRAAVPRVSRS